MGRIFFIQTYGDNPDKFINFVYETLPDLFRCESNDIKITDIFNDFLKDNPVISNKGLFRKNITKKLNFPISGRNSPNYWKHRGWSDELTLLKVFEINRTNKLKTEEKRPKSKTPTIFKFKTVVFELNSEPICNLCSSKLIYNVKLSGYDKKNIIGVIKGCDNLECETNNSNKYFKYENYLPKDVWERKKNELSSSIKKSNMLCVDYWLNKGLTEDESKNKISEIQSKRGKLIKGKNTKITKEYLKNKGYSEDEIKETCLTPSQIKFWINKGLTEDEAKNKISELQKNASKNVDHTKFFKPNQIGYWLDRGCSEDESKQKVSERQKTFSLEKCIEKYGEEEGRKRFIDRQIKWLSNYKKNNFSKISQDLFWGIINSDTTIMDNEIYFATYNNGSKSVDNKNYEYRLVLGSNIILPDFLDLKNKKIIEFDGVYYHRSTPENTLREKIRDEIILNYGYKVLHVNELEYKKNKENVIKKCLYFLTH
jgi:hypothetical protein